MILKRFIKANNMDDFVVPITSINCHKLKICGTIYMGILVTFSLI